MMGKNFTNCVDLYNKLVGSYLRMREYHFNTHFQAHHNFTNDWMPEIMDFADTIMEQCMGMFGRPGMDITKPVISKKTELIELLKEIRDYVIKFRSTIIDKDIFAGMINVIEGFLQDLNKYIYLSENK